MQSLIMKMYSDRSVTGLPSDVRKTKLNWILVLVERRQATGEAVDVDAELAQLKAQQEARQQVRS